MFEWLMPSMKAIYNSRIFDQEDIQIKTHNRAFCYGDGLFETIVTGPSRFNLIDRHLDRLGAHMSHLRLLEPEIIKKNLNKWIDELARLNQIAGDIRSKLQVWRKSGGLYSPSSNAFEFLITVKESQQPIYVNGSEIGLSKQSVNHFSSISAFKSISSMNYVMAGIEKTEKNLDDIIILDHQGYLSETHTSNLFWTKDNVIYTPDLKTGCIDGVMRRFTIDFFKQTPGIILKTVRAKQETLLNCDSIFSTNASGIKSFSQLENRDQPLHNPENLLSDLIKRLQQP